MNYKWLYKLYYSDKAEYEKAYMERYNGISTYRYNFKINDMPAFAVIDTHMVKMIYDILKANEKLSDICRSLPSEALEMYKKKCLVEEVNQTNELEGVISTRKEIADILEEKNTGDTRLTGIVNKYGMLLEDNDIPLDNCNDFRTLYDELVAEEVKYNNEKDLPDGKIFRKNKVYICNNRREIIHEGVYPEQSVIEYMNEVIEIKNNAEYVPLISIAVIHYMIGYIHPFYDGNGRFSRFLSSYLLSKNINSIISFRLAYSIKQETSSYYKIFKLTNEKINCGELTGFVIYFFELLKKTIDELCLNFCDMAERLKFYIAALANFNMEDTARQICELLIKNELFGFCELGIKDICVRLKKGDKAVRNAVKEAEKYGLIKVIKKRPYIYRIQLEKLM